MALGYGTAALSGVLPVATSRRKSWLTKRSAHDSAACSCWHAACTVVRTASAWPLCVSAHCEAAPCRWESNSEHLCSALSTARRRTSATPAHATSCATANSSDAFCARWSASAAVCRLRSTLCAVRSAAPSQAADHSRPDAAAAPTP